MYIGRDGCRVCGIWMVDVVVGVAIVVVVYGIDGGVDDANISVYAEGVVFVLLSLTLVLVLLVVLVMSVFVMSDVVLFLLTSVLLWW